MNSQHFLFAFFYVFAAMSAVMTIAWAIWRATRNSGWVDTTWTFGLGAVGIAAALFTHTNAERAILVSVLIAVWALRLGVHIARRTTGIIDDPRYAKLVREWGRNAVPQMFVLLQKQAWVSVPLGLSMLLTAWNPAPALRLQDYLGAFFLAIGIGGEALADAQLRAFRSDGKNKNKICERGLWRWSRHPNYFFEWFGWLAYPLIAIDFAGNYPWGWAAVIGPLCMYWLLVHVSGIPPLEEHMLAKRGAKFRSYQYRTSAFFPIPRSAGGKR